MSDAHDDPQSRDELGLTIEELAERFGVSVRAIRYYIAQGLLPGPGTRGKAATYGEEHVVRLGLIRQLTDRHTPLAKIEALLRGLSLDEVKALQVAEESVSAQLVEAERRQSPQDYVQALLDGARQARGLSPLAQAPQRELAPDSSIAHDTKRALRAPAPSAPGAASAGASEQANETWYRWTLAPGVELHVSAQAQARFAKLLREVQRVAGEYLNNGVNNGGS
jgi:DNA-binding transcriptional MerR regulator